MQQMTRQLAQIETYNKKLYLEGTVSWCSIQRHFLQKLSSKPKIFVHAIYGTYLLCAETISSASM